MATQVLNTRFQLKRGLEEAWNRNNPILAEGEPGWTLDSHILKIGDGKTAWKDLDPIGGVAIEEVDIQQAVNNYLDAHPVNVKTDTTLSVVGQPADAAAVREQCLFSKDTFILSAGDSDDNIFI